METHIRNKRPDKCKRCNRSGEVVKFHTRKNQIGQRYYNLICGKCRQEFNRERKRLLREKQRKEDPIGYYLQTRHEQLRVKYKMTLEEYKTIFAKQNFGCAICGKDGRSADYKYDMPVDHCHKTGKNRGILCNHCNHVLGMMEDNPETLIKAAQYLTDWA